MSWRENVPESYRNADLTEYAGLLPVGIADDDGTIHRIVQFRPDGIMTADEHKMADPKLNGNGAKSITALFSNGLVEAIGTIHYDPKHQTKFSDVIRKLTNADRDYLLMRARQITFGDALKFEHKCPDRNCKTVNEVSINIDEEIPVTYLEDDHTREEGQPVFTTELPLGVMLNGLRQRTVLFRLPIGADAEALTMLARQNMSEANNALFQRIIHRIGSIERMTAAVFNTMSAKDRQFFNRELADITPGPNFKTKIICAGCGDEISITIPTQAFLSDSL